MPVVATAGHVDHGKSALVAALTGIDPDRWPEEKARGLTIDLGFAHTTLASGREVSLVDVPGHVRFLSNMVAGVGAVDACLLVVAATEGWKPQSEEHLRILDLLGVPAGLIVVTKTAPAGAARRALVVGEVGARVAGTFLAGAPVVAVDSVTGEGLDRLRAALDTVLAGTTAAADEGRPRLWVDRSFAIRGAGTVVTGTLAGGGLATGEPVVAAGPTAGGAPVRVREIQVHGEPRDRVGPGHRVALNLHGVDHRRIGRGDAVVRGGQWHGCRRFDATLTVLGSLEHPVSRRGAFTVHLGSGAHAAAVRILGPEAIAPGGSGWVRVHLRAAVPLLPGDRYVLREHGRSETVGGGEVLDVDPVRPAARARPNRSVTRVVAERGWVDASDLTRLTGAVVAPDVGPWVVDPSLLAASVSALEERVRSAGPLGLDLAPLDARSRLMVERVRGVSVSDGRARLRPPVGTVVETTAGSAGGSADHPWLAALAASPWSPPDPASMHVGRDNLRALVLSGRVVDAGGGVWFAAEAVDEAARRVAGLLATRPGVTVADVRDALGSSRRFVLALLHHLDATGITRRRGDLRIGGPRLPPPD